MFFVSEEFLRKYQAGEEFVQTIDEVVAPGRGLFEEYESKVDHRVEHGTKGKGGTE